MLERQDLEMAFIGWHTQLAGCSRPEKATYLCWL